MELAGTDEWLGKPWPFEQFTTPYLRGIDKRQIEEGVMKKKKKHFRGVEG